MGAVVKSPGRRVSRAGGRRGSRTNPANLPLAKGGAGTSARNPPCPLVREPVGLEEIGPGRWLLYFGRLPLGVIDQRLPKIQRPA